jgi:16S rRNA (guanine527-N7)-methyltransferase
MKGRYPMEEITDLPQEWDVVSSHTLQVPNLNAERHLLELQPNRM